VSDTKQIDEIHQYARHNISLWVQVIVFALGVQSLVLGWLLSKDAPPLSGEFVTLLLSPLLILFVVTWLFSLWLHRAVERITALGAHDISLTFYQYALMAGMAAIVGYALLWVTLLRWA
jgi:hypothetical protein